MRWKARLKDERRTDDGEDSEEVADQRVPEVEGALQVVDPGPLLDRDETRRHEHGEEAVEDEEVRDAGHRIA